MAAEGSGSKNFKLMIYIGVVVAVIGSGVAAYFLAPKILGGKDKKEETQTEEKADSEDKDKKTEKKEDSKTIVPIKTLLVNLQGGEGRFLKINIELETRNKDAAKEINQNMPQIRDKLINILSEKKAGEISLAEGKRKLKHEIIRRTNKIIGSGKVRKVYFSDFVMQ